MNVQPDSEQQYGHVNHNSMSCTARRSGRHEILIAQCRLDVFKNTQHCPVQSRHRLPVFCTDNIVGQWVAVEEEQGGRAALSGAGTADPRAEFRGPGARGRESAIRVPWVSLPDSASHIALAVSRAAPSRHPEIPPSTT